MENLLTDAISILQEKGYKKHCHPLEALSNTVETNGKIAARKIRFYKWAGLFLLTLIPLVSALLSVSVGLKDGDTTWLETTILSLSLPLSLLLTVATILNSIFRPSERFRNACLIGVRIGAFKEDFLSALQRLEKVEERTLLDLVDKKRKDFEKYQEDLIGLFMPMETSAQQRAPDDANKRRA
ncbi:MAG: hypothetical protein IDH49_03395 [Gammaproteobacteria bacterium]|nr:hypothetical protein [Gammaproteobacteria bacterium]